MKKHKTKLEKIDEQIEIFFATLFGFAAAVLVVTLFGGLVAGLMI